MRKLEKIQANTTAQDGDMARLEKEMKRMQERMTQLQAIHAAKEEQKLRERKQLQLSQTHEDSVLRRHRETSKLICKILIFF